MTESAKIIFSLLLAAVFMSSGPAGSAENSSSLYKKGAALALAGKYEESSLVFKQVIDMSPHYCLGHYGLGKVYLYKYGMLDQAAIHLSKAVELDRRFSKGYFYLGLAYMLSHKYTAALHAFDLCFRYDQTYMEALFNMSIIYDIMGNDYKAAIYYKRYSKLKAGDEEFLFQ